MNTPVLFQALLEASWQGSLIILLLLAARPLLGARIPARWRHALWLLALIRLLVPAVLLPPSPARLPTPAVIERPVETATLALDRATVAVAAPDWIMARPLFPQEFDAVPPVSEPPRRKTDWWQVAAFVWLGGAAALALGIFATVIRFQRRLRADGSPVAGEVGALWSELQRRLGLRRAPELLATDVVDSPTLAGFFQPRLLVPRSGLENLAAADWEHIFLHELAHWRRRDHWTQALQLAALCIHWFNPLVWAGLRGLRADRELAADEWALRHLPADRSLAYGDTLVKVLRAQSGLRLFPTTVGIAESGAQLRQRMRRIAAFGPRSLAGSIAGVTLTLLLGVVVLGRQAGRADLSDYAELEPRDVLVEAAEAGDLEVIREMLDRGLDVNAKGTAKDPRTPLVAAAAEGRLEALRLLLSRGGALNPPDEDSAPALVAALSRAQLECAHYLLEKGAKCHPLLLAAARGEVAEIELMLAAEPPDFERAETLARIAAANGRAEAFGRFCDEIRALPGQSGWEISNGWIVRAVAAGHRGVVEQMMKRGSNLEHGVIRLSGAAAKAGGMREWLATKGVEVPEHNSGEQLIDAAEKDDLGEIRRLLDAGADIDYRGESGWTPLAKAGTWGRPRAVKLLLERGADPEKRKGEYWYPLSLAKTPEIAEMLFQAGADPNGRNGKEGDGSSAIEYGTTFGSVELVRWFIDKGVDPTKATSGEPTLLFFVGKPEVAELLIEHGVDVTPTNKFGRTALHWCLKFSHSPAEVARVLLEHGADPNAKDERGTTPLMLAPDAATVDVLVEYGADIQELRGSGKGFGISSPQADPEGRLEALRRHGLEVDLGKEGPRLLFSAVMTHRVDQVKSLLASGVDPNAIAKYPGSSNSSALTLAILQGQMRIIALLREAGANDVGKLTEAVALGDLKRARELLASGADVNERNGTNETPLIFSVHRGQVESVKLLLEHGADVNLFTDGGFTAEVLAATFRWFMEMEKGDFAPVSGMHEKREAVPAIAAISDLLAARKPNIETRNAQGLTVLHQAAIWGSVIAKPIFDKGADIDAQTPAGMTPLMLAIASKPFDAKKTAVISDQNETVRTEATMHGNFVKTLLDKGADMTLRNAEGKTALDLAREKGDAELIELLEAAAK